MVKFFPEREYINRMKPPPTAGEQVLLNSLRSCLGKLNGEFEIFFRARLSEGVADIAVVRRNYGVLIIKVAECDSDFTASIVQAKSLKENFCAACRLRGQKKIFAPIQTAVFFHGVTKEQIKKFFGFSGKNDSALLYNYVLLLTEDGIGRDGLQSLPKLNFLVSNQRSKFFTEELYSEICRTVKPFGEINSADELSDEQRQRLEPLLENPNPNVKFFPELSQLQYMRPFPTNGELYLLKFLRDYLGKLDGEFEVFFQAHWDGSFPDVVVMRKNHGILIIEVKDWNLDSFRRLDKKVWILRGEEHKIKSPTAQVRKYQSLFYNTYSRTLADKKLWYDEDSSLVQAAVFFYGSTRERVRNFFGGLTEDYVTMLTQEELEQNGLKNIPYAQKYFLGDQKSDFFPDDVYKELHRVLKPNEHSLSKIFIPEKLDKRQLELAESDGLRHHIKGPAGSGKTTIMAFRAVDAFKRTNESVLILTFNITLRHYIHDCISHALNSISGIEGRKSYIMGKFFLIRHFHEFIKNYRNDHNQLDIEKLDEKGKRVDTYELKAAPDKYRTIFVDETQDFKREWLETIVYDLLEPNGEIVFFSDKDQDLYQRRVLATNSQEKSPPPIPGIKGRPLELKGTYRLHTKILDLARRFQIKFFDGSVGNEIEPPEVAENLSDDTTIRYHFREKLDVKEIVDIFESVIREYQIANDDVCILSQVIRNVRPVDKVLRDKGYKTITTFETEEEWQKICRFDKMIRDQIRRVAKHNFWMESGKIKLSTIQSYKGWGIHTEILIIGNDFSAANGEEKFLNDEMVYTGITRAKKNLIVINIGDKEYDEFFRATISDAQDPTSHT